MIRSLISLLLLTLALAGCRSATQQPEKTYDMQGVVKALDPATKSATIQHGKIGDWMDAMTMEYRVKPDADFLKLHVGDRVEAKVKVRDMSYYITDVKVQ